MNGLKPTQAVIGSTYLYFKVPTTSAETNPIPGRLVNGGDPNMSYKASIPGYHLYDHPNAIIPNQKSSSTVNKNITVSDINDVHRVKFRWYNQGTSSTTTNISIQLMECEVVGSSSILKVTLSTLTPAIKLTNQANNTLDIELVMVPRDNEYVVQVLYRDAYDYAAETYLVEYIYGGTGNTSGSISGGITMTFPYETLAI